MERTLLSKVCEAMGWQGGTIHQAISELEISKPYNVRRYGKDFFGTVDVEANGEQVGTIDAWFSDIKECRKNKALIAQLVRVISDPVAL